MKVLRAFAVLFALLAVSNFLKPFLPVPEIGFVFLGKRLSGAASLLTGWAFALFLGAYASALWRGAPIALPMGIAYAGYTGANLHYSVTDSLKLPVLTADRYALCLIALLGFLSAVAAVVAMVSARRHGAMTGAESVPGRLLLRSFALLFGLMALSNALKPFRYAPDVGFIFFGHRLQGASNAVGGLAFSALLAVYAAGIWTERRWALPLSVAYALYVPLNIILWNSYNPNPGDMPLPLALPYILSAVGVSSGAAVLLWRHRQRLV
jgi:hypothetical protein